MASITIRFKNWENAIISNPDKYPRIQKYTTLGPRMRIDR